MWIFIFAVLSITILMYSIGPYIRVFMSSFHQTLYCNCSTGVDEGTEY
jgi:hypothetical protein